MNAASRRVADLVVTVQDCFLENPGVALTPCQIEQLCGADAGTCEAILDLLAGGGVIARTSNGRYKRRVRAPRRWLDRGRRAAGARDGISRIALAG